MKKLLILAGTIVVACSLNAAQFAWGLASGDYQDKSGNELLTGTAFLYLGNVTATESAFNFGTSTFVASAGFDDVNYSYGYVDTSSASTLQSSDAVASTAAGQAYSIILVDKSGLASLDGYTGDYTIITGTSTEETILAATPVKYASFVDGLSSAYTTSTMSAVPEPTSGLLMLLGIAGLALRRRRV